MKINTYFNLGDKVWLGKRVTINNKCPDCGGTGKVLSLIGRAVQCCFCFGHGYITTPLGLEPVSSKITRIYVDWEPCTPVDIKYRVEDAEFEQELFDENELFMTREQCEESFKKD